MEKTPKHFIIVAGEVSGDTHAAHLVESIRRKDPSAIFSGLGGPKMQKAGVKLYADLTQYAVVGFVEVLKHYPEFKKLFDLILKKAIETNPAAIILVDYPGFNLRLAKALKKHNQRIIYYISPQVWAWKENRVQQIKNYVDRMLVLFKFEKDFYAKHNYAVDFVGHPMIDSVHPSTPKTDFLTSIGLEPNKPTIGLLPGSRQKEVEALLPAMLDAAHHLNTKNSNLQFLIFKASTISREFLEPFIQSASIKVTLVEENEIDNGLNACDYCIVTSGTATLQTALMIKPMVVVYKTSLISYLLAKLFIKIPYIGMVNVVAGKKIVPECIQFDATGKRIAKTLSEIMASETKTAETKTALKNVKQSLGGPGASERAASLVLETAA